MGPIWLAMEELEEKIAHLTRALDDLSDVVARQDREITRLTGIVDALVSRARDADQDAGGGVVLGDERPPHY
ncbi:SlyX protein [Litoreibacter ponti]|uniref:SlyX protein n=2 Tax=Litoreibacter ponti TaxID=1510457 RepID=A0A2T6BE46_9RHOB|nr:SlyX protein [Litoreibacter ponti]